MQIQKRAILYGLLAFSAILSLLFLAVPGTFVAAKALNTLSPSLHDVTSPTVVGNFLVDQDHGLLFSKNKQNEPAITRDPLTGVLIAGANDEFEQPLCSGTTIPLASPCPFAPGVPTSAYYRSTDDGKTWTGGFLPGFNTIGRVSGGDPSLDSVPGAAPTARSASPAELPSTTAAWPILSQSSVASRSPSPVPTMTARAGPIR